MQSSAGKDKLQKKIKKQPKSAAQRGLQQAEQLSLNLGFFLLEEEEAAGHNVRPGGIFPPAMRGGAVSLLPQSGWSSTPAPTWLCPWGTVEGTTRT